MLAMIFQGQCNSKEFPSYLLQILKGVYYMELQFAIYESFIYIIFYAYI